MPPKGYKYDYKRVFTNWCTKCKTTFQAYSPNKTHDHGGMVQTVKPSGVHYKHGEAPAGTDPVLIDPPVAKKQSVLADLIEAQIPVPTPERISINDALDELYRRVAALEYRIGE